MTVSFITTNTIVPNTDGFELLMAGDEVYVNSNTLLASGRFNGVQGGSPGIVVDNGDIVGTFYGIRLDSIVTPGDSEVWIGSRGTVEGGNGAAGIYIPGGSFTIQNLGQILTAGATGVGVQTYGAGAVINSGSISAANGGVIDSDTVAADRYVFENYGSVVASNAGSFAFSGAVALSGSVALEAVYNYGTMNGSVAMGSAAGDFFDSTSGAVHGAIDAGAGGDTIVAGNTGNLVVGGAGNDVLFANPTLTAASNHANTILDGGTGDNWLYGDGAYVTFDSGDNSAGTCNQIFGRQSEMANVSGYANNTVSYAAMSSAYKSAYIDLLHGDAYMCASASANGAPTSAYVFEDYLQHVPNVIGSSGSDVIVCDNGADKITHGSGAGDVLYAGSGASSQDTFAYTSLTQSSLAHHDVIEGFKTGTDKIDLSALGLPTADILLSSGGNGANTIYVEKSPTTGFNSATDMIISVQATGNGILTMKDIVG